MYERKSNGFKQKNSKPHSAKLIFPPHSSGDLTPLQTLQILKLPVAD
jgi:hypothetical protein